MRFVGHQNKTGAKVKSQFSERFFLKKSIFSGYVTHGSDRVLWALRIPILEPDQVEIAKTWLKKVAEEVNKLIYCPTLPRRNVREMLTLKDDRSIGWTKDEKWDTLMKLEKVFDI